MHRTAIKTVLALMLSTGLVACVTDDSDTDTQDTSDVSGRAYDPDPIPQEKDQNNVQPGDEHENPADAPGRIPAPVQGTPNVHVQGQTTTDVGLNHGNVVGTQDITVERTTTDVSMTRGSVDTSHVTGQNIGYTCDGQQVGCRTASPQLMTQRR